VIVAGMALGGIRVQRRHPFTLALIARMSVPPPAALVPAIDGLVRSLVGAGVWAKLDMLKIQAVHDEQAARLNWISSDYTSTAVNSPTFTAYRGFNGNGTPSYMNTGFNPGAAIGAKFVRDSASLGLWSLTNSSNVVNDMGNWNGGWGASIQARWSEGVFTVAANSGVLANDPSDTSLGFFSWSRSNSTNVEKYKNATLVRTEAKDSSPVHNMPIYLGAINFNNSATSFGARQYACVFAGGALSQSEQSATYTALYSYLSHPAVGAV